MTLRLRSRNKVKGDSNFVPVPIGTDACQHAVSRLATSRSLHLTLQAPISISIQNLDHKSWVSTNKVARKVWRNVP